jgi:hypothetical protein
MILRKFCWAQMDDIVSDRPDVYRSWRDLSDKRIAWLRKGGRGGERGHEGTQSKREDRKE